MQLRRCSGVIIYRYSERYDEYEVLLIRTRNFRNLYLIVGGGIEEQDVGETLEKRAESCAVRETHEEVRLGIREIVYIGMKTAKGKDIGYKDPTMNFEFYDFVAQADGELNALEILFANDEVFYAGFHRQRELSSLPIEPKLKALIQRCYTGNYFKK